MFFTTSFYHPDLIGVLLVSVFLCYAVANILTEHQMKSAICPQCRRPVIVRSQPRCLYCGANLSLGTVQNGITKKILSRHPGFSLLTFVEQTKALFCLLQRCRMEKNFETLNLYFAQNLVEQYKIESLSFEKKKLQHHLEKISIGEIMIKEYQSIDSQEKLSIQIDAVMADYIVDEQTHIVTQGIRNPTPFREYWKLIGKALYFKIQPREAEIFFCPNCHAPLKLGNPVKCDYCGFWVVRGDFNWQVTKIWRHDQKELYEEWKNRFAELQRSGVSESLDSLLSSDWGDKDPNNFLQTLCYIFKIAVRSF
ncbi:MAG: TIM44-like domain-containing protein [Candidatus Edwardsbacteria bacterium]